MTGMMNRMLLALTLALPLPTLAASADAELAARLKAIRSLQADFSQTSEQGGKNAAAASAPVQTPQRQTVVLGSLSASKPGMFRWETRQPYQQLIVSDGKDIRIFDPDLQQMTIRAVDKAADQTPALLFSGDLRALKQFSVTSSQTGGLTEFQLKPKAKDALFAALRLQFKGSVPFAMLLDDSLGQKTRIEFIKPVLNQPVPADQFRLVPPKGTDIIRE